MNVVVPRNTLTGATKLTATLEAPGAAPAFVSFALNLDNTISNVRIRLGEKEGPMDAAYYQTVGNKLVLMPDRKPYQAAQIYPELEDGLMYKPQQLSNGQLQTKLLMIKNASTVENYRLEIYRLKDGATLYQSNNPLAGWDGSATVAGSYGYRIYSGSAVITQGQFLLVKN